MNEELVVAICDKDGSFLAWSPFWSKEMTTVRARVQMFANRSVAKEYLEFISLDLVVLPKEELL